MKVNGIEISHPDKVLFPDSGLTKERLAKYYARIADRMLPFLKKRPLTLRCFPEGIDSDGFFNKNTPDHFPDFIARVAVPSRESGRSTVVMSSAGSARDLAYFAGQNAIELHATLSSRDDLEKPDQVIFDFDPQDGDFARVRRLALGFSRLLHDLDLPVFWKTTGSRGLHAHIPIRRTHGFAEVKERARALAERLHEAFPEESTLELRTEKRGGKVFIDTLRNEYGQTAILPYSVRARPGAPVAAPIRLHELESAELTPDRFTIGNIFRRLGRIEDPWKHFTRSRVDLP